MAGLIFCEYCEGKISVNANVTRCHHCGKDPRGKTKEKERQARLIEVKCRTCNDNIKLPNPPTYYCTEPSLTSFSRAPVCKNCKEPYVTEEIYNAFVTWSEKQRKNWGSCQKCRGALCYSSKGYKRWGSDDGGGYQEWINLTCTRCYARYQK